LLHVRVDNFLRSWKRIVKIEESGLSFFYFLFYLFIIVSIFRTWGIGIEVICHTVTSVISDGVVTTLITGLKR